MPYPIFPSLSRAPSFASTRKIEDGTLKDPMESGYVTTRPRFTRLRRTFGVSYKFLSAEDVRALDKFETQTVQGGAGAFYLPNLVPNGSFEQSSPGGGIANWNLIPSPNFTAALSPAADDGSLAVAFVSSASAVDGHVSVDLISDCLMPVTAGDTYSFTYRVNFEGAIPAGISSATAVIAIHLNYSDGSSVTNGVCFVGAPTEGYVTASESYTIPASGGGATVATMVVDLSAQMVSTAGAVDVAAGQMTFLIDEVGVALTGSAKTSGRMPGLSPLLSAVRFTKGLQIRDAGIANGQKTYDVTFEVTEI